MNINFWYVLPVLLPVSAVITEPTVLQNDSAGFRGFIANGVVYDPVKYPYLIRLHITDDIGNIGLCTGSLLNQNFVLTAAHCTEDRPNVTRYKVLRFDKITSHTISPNFKIKTGVLSTIFA